MKFDEPQHQSENNSCEFLDLNISIKNGKLVTDLFRKPTSKPTALLPSSAHPGHITHNIVYSMAFRLLRICSTEESFEIRLEELKSDFLMPRNYSKKVIESQFSRIRNLPGLDYQERRKNSLVKKEKKKQTLEEKSRVISPLDFNPLLPNISEIFKKHHKSMLFKKPELKEVFNSAPMASLRQPPNIRSLLCRSSLFQPNRGKKFQRNTHREAPGWKKCGRGSTTCCPFALPATQKIVGQVTGYQHDIKDPVNCETTNCIYYWKCRKDNCRDFPKCEYVGLTSRPFRNRLAEHKQYIRSENKDKSSGAHFNKAGHNISHLAGLVIEHVKSDDPFVLRAREFLYIQKFDTYRNGLNQEP